jgi:hypothetical protein
MPGRAEKSELAKRFLDQERDPRGQRFPTRHYSQQQCAELHTNPIVNTRLYCQL